MEKEGEIIQDGEKDILDIKMVHNLHSFFSVCNRYFDCINCGEMNIEIGNGSELNICIECENYFCDDCIILHCNNDN